VTSDVAQTVAARCARARSRSDSLLAGCATWTVDIVTFLAPDGLSQVTKPYVVDPDAPLAWALDMSELLHSARAALDNTAYSLAEAQTGVLSSKQARKIYFPVTTAEADYRKAAVGEMLKPLSPAARAAIEAAQPWQQASPMEHPLAMLAALSNIDKHRRLSLAASSTTGVNVPWLRDDPAVESCTAGMGPITSDLEMLKIKYYEPQTDPRYYDFGLTVVHWIDEPPVPREDLRTLAPRVVDHVEQLSTHLLKDHTAALL
jgi:hypothetical protein